MMPIVTRTTSSQKMLEKNIKEKLSSSSSTATNMVCKKTKSSKRCKGKSGADTREPTTPKNNKRPVSPILLPTPPSKKFKTNDNDSLIAQLEESEKQDLELQQRLRQALDDSDDVPLRSIYKNKNVTGAKNVQVSGYTKNGSAIVYTAPLFVPSDSEENGSIENDQDDKSQEYPPNNVINDDEQADEIRSLKARNSNLISSYQTLHGKYNLLVDRHNKLTKKMARAKKNSMDKPPTVVLKWMSHLLQLADPEEAPIVRTPEQCSKIIDKAAETLKVLPGQLKACFRDSMQKTARKVAFVIWPDAVTRSKVNSKNVDRELLKLIHDICEALHPDLDKNESIMNTAIFNVCSSTRKHIKDNKLANLDLTNNTDIDDIATLPLIIDEDSSDDEENTNEDAEEHEDTETDEDDEPNE